jgi:hypothetical protein
MTYSRRSVSLYSSQLGMLHVQVLPMVDSECPLE